MKKAIKKIVTGLSLASLLFVSMPKQKAHAGLLLSPAYGTGVFLIILGVVYDSLGLIILDENTEDLLTQKMEERYGHLTDNQQVFENLASTLSSKIEGLEVVEETELELTQDEIEAALGTSVMNTELLEAVEQDLL
jgi:ABC-type lipopolysaccharide export system ATPase subunit